MTRMSPDPNWQELLTQFYCIVDEVAIPNLFERY